MSNSYNFEGLKKKTIENACRVSIKAHKSEKPYSVDEKISGCVVIAFPGSGSLNNWYAGDKPFGETKDLNIFPSLRSIGNDEVATVNKAFLDRFLEIITKDKVKASFCKTVEKAVKDKKKIIFAGHSSGGPIAIFAAVWFFEEYIRSEKFRTPPFCLTFGSPLTGDRIFCHAVRREKWSDYFINFVTSFDIVPCILLAPLSSVKDELPKVLSHFNPNSQSYGQESTETGDTSKFFEKVMENASCAASHAACTLTDGTDELLNTLSNFIDVSPYRPFGTHVFCSESGKLLAVKNPSAVLQLLFHSSLSSSLSSSEDIASKSFKRHLAYDTELKMNSMQNVPLFDKFQEIPIVLDNGAGDETKVIDEMLNDFGMSERGRLSLHAAVASEKQKADNQSKFEKSFLMRREDGDCVEKLMETLKKYRENCETRGIGYYDSFRKSEDENDFEANVTRLKLAGVWDEIIEMLKRYELPDTFEGEKSWVDRGTELRHLVEPLDIANFYRHSKQDTTGPYMGPKGRPRRYRYTQRWLEHYEKLPKDSRGESCFWAELEQDLYDAEKHGISYINDTDRVKKLEKTLEEWYGKDLITKGVFFENSTLVRWWNRLPLSHRQGSCIKGIIQRNATSPRENIEH